MTGEKFTAFDNDGTVVKDSLIRVFRKEKEGPKGPYAVYWTNTENAEGDTERIWLKLNTKLAVQLADRWVKTKNPEIDQLILEDLETTVKKKPYISAKTGEAEIANVTWIMSVTFP
jgi:hypothetical protein